MTDKRAEWEKELSELAMRMEDLLRRSKEAGVDLGGLSLSLYERGLALSRVASTDVNEVVVGLPKLLVPCGATVALTATVDSPILPEVFYFDSEAAKSFSVALIRVGTRSVFAPNYPVPASLFASRVFGPHLHVGVVFKGEVLSVIVTNRDFSKPASEISCAVVGIDAERMSV